jgi:hypothetical protein
MEIHDGSERVYHPPEEWAAIHAKRAAGRNRTERLATLICGSPDGRTNAVRMFRLTQCSIWKARNKRMTNQAALGYMILAMKRKGYTEEQIREVEGSMLYMMDMKTEKEAEEEYRKF